MKIHFIGIGGIGVSALAGYYLKNGFEVTGSDLAFSETTEFLEKLGAKIFIGKHKAENIEKAIDLVVHSPAVFPENPEIKQAKKLKIKIQSYPEALGELTKKYFTIAISGTHGKSTTTAMIALILSEARLSPTVIVGTKLKEFNGSNFKTGRGKYLVIEADEWQASFLNYWPQIIVLTNIEEEHLDYYKDLKHILKTYKEYIGHLPNNGTLVLNGDDKNIVKLISNYPCLKAGRQLPMPQGRQAISKYGLSKSKDAIKLRRILKVPGRHNISNALAALAVARILKIPDEVSFGTLSSYKGAWRRFEVKKAEINGNKITVVSDYGHHPTEVRATLNAALEKYNGQKIWCVFQPHQYQRTYYLFEEFVKVFQELPLEKIIITDIYSVAGREKAEIKKKVNAKKLAEAIKKSEAIYLKKEKIKEYLAKNLQGGEVVIIMGAGDIYKLAASL